MKNNTQIICFANMLNWLDSYLIPLDIYFKKFNQIDLQLIENKLITKLTYKKLG